jgi:hypothetical protein
MRRSQVIRHNVCDSEPERIALRINGSAVFKQDAASNAAVLVHHGLGGLVEAVDTIAQQQVSVPGDGRLAVR